MPTAIKKPGVADLEWRRGEDASFEFDGIGLDLNLDTLLVHVVDPDSWTVLATITPLKAVGDVGNDRIRVNFADDFIDLSGYPPRDEVGLLYAVRRKTAADLQEVLVEGTITLHPTPSRSIP